MTELERAVLKKAVDTSTEKGPPIGEIPMLSADSFTFDRYYSDTWTLIKEFAEAEGKSLVETFQKYCIGYCPGDKLLVRPCPGDLVAMIQIGGDKYWIHLPARAYIDREWWPVYDLFAKVMA